MNNTINNMYDDKKNLKDYMPGHKTLSNIAGFFNVFSDITRIKVIIALALHEMCVTELVNSLNLHQSTISHQLKLLRDANIVSYRRKGKQLYYYISNQYVEDIMLTGTRNLETS